jgi:5-methylcytosine-specific restriction endonuclease McrA
MGFSQKTMQRLRQKHPRLKLSLEDYNLLRKRVLERDGWRCQNCGSSKDLHVHHLAKRSKLGDDALNNLITLCVICHQRQHHFRLLLTTVSPNRDDSSFNSRTPFLRTPAGVRLSFAVATGNVAWSVGCET